jgi:tRNA A-37 threonylcarbamoyl transferase component Bud32
MFFGRTHELQEIAAFLRGNQSVSIIGPRKIGKTSLLFHLMRLETWTPLGLDDKNLFVYLDCEVLGEGAHDIIFGQFASELAATLDARGLPPEPSLDNAINKPTRLSFEGAIRKLNQRGLRVVLILDEFERLSANASLDVNFFNALRSAAGRYQLVFLTASARPLIELTYSGKSQEILSSPFFNIFAPLFLGLLPESDARTLMHEPMKRANIIFSSTVGNFIYLLVGGHPLALQVACFHAFDANGVTAQIERKTMQELTSHFEYYWRNLSPTEQSALANVSDAVLRESSDTTMRGVLRNLVQKCLLVHEHGDYRYPSRAWQNFVAAQNSQAAKAPVASGPVTGRKLGAYEVLEPLGHGGMAEVYKGRHPRLDRTVAIKILPTRLAIEEDFRQRFEREARAIAALKHPNIVQVFDFGDADGTYYMVMEYIAGKDLSQHMQATGAMPLTQVLPIMRDIASALDYAHGQGLVHRDIKPSNVMLENDVRQIGNLPYLRAVLMDFGIAKILGGNLGDTKSGMMMGTLDYMSPEQIRSAGEVDRRADIYALGIMAYQMVTGQLPFKANDLGGLIMAHLQQAAPDPRSLAPSLSEHAAEAILRALAKDPRERFVSAGEFVGAMG